MQEIKCNGYSLKTKTKVCVKYNINRDDKMGTYSQLLKMICLFKFNKMKQSLSLILCMISHLSSTLRKLSMPLHHFPFLSIRTDQTNKM